MPPPNDDVLRQLDAVDDWTGLVERIIAYAVQLAKIEYRWRAGTLLPKGNDIKDIVYTVIKKLYSGERTWEPDRVPLETWLRNNVRSEMNNLFRSAFTPSRNLREVPLETDDDSVPVDATEHHAVEEGVIGDKPVNPETVLIEKEKRRQRDNMINALYRAIEGDDILEAIYFAVLEGGERKPQILAEKIGVSVSEINNALRRLDRRVVQLAERKGFDNE